MIIISIIKLLLFPFLLLVLACYILFRSEYMTLQHTTAYNRTLYYAILNYVHRFFLLIIIPIIIIMIMMIIIIILFIHSCLLGGWGGGILGLLVEGEFRVLGV